MKIKPAADEYLEKAKELSEEESQRLSSRMRGKPARKLEDKKLSTLEALAIQLEIDDELLSEWRKNMFAIKEKEAKKAAKEGETKEKAAKQKAEKLNKEKGYTFCMIEHDMDFIGRLCDPVIVMAEGSVLFEGTVEAAKKDEKVIESYLGKGSKLKSEN